MGQNNIPEWFNEIKWIDEEELNGFPSIIMHEFARIKSMLLEGETYGAFMELKDTIEVVLKFYITIGIAEIYQKEFKTENEVEILSKLTEKPLSLGDWAYIERLMCNIEFTNDLREILKVLYEWSANDGNVKIVNWRNRCIGHGALGYYERETYRKDFIDKYQLVTEFLRENKELLCNVQLAVGKPEKFEIHEWPKYKEEINDREAELYAYYRNEKRLIQLFPFLSIYNHNYYFFDSYLKSDEKTDLLNYFWGVKDVAGKTTFISRIIKEIHNTYSISNDMNSFSDGSIEDSVFKMQDQLLLENINKANKTVRNTSFEKWMNEKVNNNDKGIFLLEARSGMGKTVCVKQLDRRGNTKIRIQNTTVRAIYINTFSNFRTGLILQDLEYKMICDKDYRITLRGEGIKSINKADPDEGRSLAVYLNYMKQILQEQHLCEKKLIVVFDGLDELHEKELGFIDYIPSEELLDDGIYILLSCRSEDELTPYQKTKLSSLRVKNENRLNLNVNDSVEDLMCSYIERELQRENKKNYEKILSLAQKRFAYLFFAVNMLKAEVGSIEEEKEISIETLTTSYIEKIKKTYSKKYASTYFYILHILLSASHQLTIKDMSILLGERKISFELLGVLQDMNGILNTEREIETLYSINHLRDCLGNQTNDDLFILEIKDVLIDRWKDILGDIKVLVYENNDKHRQISDQNIQFLSLMFESDYINSSDKLRDIVSIEFLVLLYKKLMYVSGYTNFDITVIRQVSRLCTAVVTFLENKGDYDKKAFEVNEDDTFNPLGNMLNDYLVNAKNDSLFGDFDNPDNKNIKMLIVLFSSQIDWMEWFTDKIARNDYKDIVEENSRIHDYFNYLDFAGVVRFPIERGYLLSAEITYAGLLAKFYRALNMKEEEIKYILNELNLLTFPEMDKNRLKESYSLYIRLYELYSQLGNKEKTEECKKLAEENKSINKKVNSVVSIDVLKAEVADFRMHLDEYTTSNDKINDGFDKISKCADKLEEMFIDLKYDGTMIEIANLVQEVYLSIYDLSRACFEKSANKLLYDHYLRGRRLFKASPQEIQIRWECNRIHTILVYASYFLWNSEFDVMYEIYKELPDMDVALDYIKGIVNEEEFNASKQIMAALKYAVASCFEDEVLIRELTTNIMEPEIKYQVDKRLETYWAGIY